MKNKVVAHVSKELADAFGMEAVPDVIVIEKPSHTPTPWRAIVPAGNFTKYTLVATESGQPFKHGDEIADIMDETNAAFIVKACNSHGELVEALKLMVGYQGHGKSPEERVEIARRVLARAEGKE
jgi:hypothetical protein